MYVLNAEDVFDSEKMYKCGEVVANWLTKKGFPLLGRTSDEKYLFSKTDELKEALAKMPFYFKIL